MIYYIYNDSSGMYDHCLWYFSTFSLGSPGEGLKLCPEQGYCVLYCRREVTVC
jgi:hypothetical protein